jgi:hypothetical protein
MLLILSFFSVSPIWSMIDGWMPSVGSSRMSSFGLVSSARPMASCCCWPPESTPPLRESISFSTGKSAKTRSSMRRASGRGPVHDQADLQVFLDRQVRKDVAALRHVADAGPGARVGRQRSMRRPSK